MGRVARRKVLRDLWLARGRTAVLVFALAISLTAVGAVLGAYGILVREMPRSFLGSSPASATLVVHGGSDELIPPSTSLIVSDVGGAERLLYPALRHEMLNEPEGPEVVGDIISWLDRKLTNSH